MSNLTNNLQEIDIDLEQGLINEEDDYLFFITNNKKNIVFNGPIKSLKKMSNYKNPSIINGKVQLLSEDGHVIKEIDSLNNKIILFHQSYPPNFRAFIDINYCRVNITNQYNLIEFMHISGYNLIVDSKNILELIDKRITSNITNLITKRFKIIFELSDKSIKEFNKKITSF